MNIQKTEAVITIRRKDRREEIIASDGIVNNKLTGMAFSLNHLISEIQRKEKAILLTFPNEIDEAYQMTIYLKEYLWSIRFKDCFKIGRFYTKTILLGVTNEVGHSSTSRLHNLFIKMEGMSRGEFKNGGEALEVLKAHFPNAQYCQKIDVFQQNAFCFSLNVLRSLPTSEQI